MFTSRPSNHRRRSKSTSSPSLRALDSPKHLPTKRANPHTIYSADFCSTRKRVTESWRNKRRRRDTSSSGLSSDDEINDVDRVMHNNGCILGDAHTPTPAFAATSAEFQLFPRHNRTRHGHGTAPQYNFSAHHNDAPSLAELSRLRSNAFWELQRSVMENGEGLVRRMRDYEHSRSRADAYVKIKDAQKRGRKRSSLMSPIRKTVPPSQVDSDEEEDDIQIFSGEIPQPFFHHHTLSSSADRRSRSAPGIERCSSPSNSSYMTDDEQMSCSELASSTFSSSSHSSPFSSITTSPANQPIEDFVDIGPTSYPLAPPSTNTSSSRSEKAIAALTLALANGSGSINDYEALRSLEPVLALDESQVGELWH